MIEHDPLTEEQGEPCDPQIARVHEVRFPELTPKREGQATAQVPQHRGAKRCAGSDHRHARQRGCRSAISLVRSGNVQPRPRGEGGQVSRGRYENLGIRLSIGEGILEGKEDLHAIDKTDTTLGTTTPVAAVIAEFRRNWIERRQIGPK